MVDDLVKNRIDPVNNRNQPQHQPGSGQETDGLVGKNDESINKQIDPLGIGPHGHSFFPILLVILQYGGFVSQPDQLQIDAGIFLLHPHQLLCHGFIHEEEIKSPLRIIGNHPLSDQVIIGVRKPVLQLRAFPPGTYSQIHLISPLPGGHQLRNQRWRILQIRTDHGNRLPLRYGKAGHHCPKFPEIPRQFNDPNPAVLLLQSFRDLQGAVFRSVVHQNPFPVIFRHPVEHRFPDLRPGVIQIFLVIVTRGYN